MRIQFYKFNFLVKTCCFHKSKPQLLQHARCGELIIDIYEATRCSSKFCDSGTILRTKCHYIQSRDITCLKAVTIVFRVLFLSYVQVLTEEEIAVDNSAINISLSITFTGIYDKAYTVQVYDFCSFLNIFGRKFLHAFTRF